MSTPIRPIDGPDRPHGNNEPDAHHDGTVSDPGTYRDSGDALPGDRPFTDRDRADRDRTDRDQADALIPDRATIVARQKDSFGGVKVGSAFFGWLTATGMAVLLIALLASAGVAFSVATDTSVDQAF